MSIEKKIFAATICTCKGDLSKRWFIKVKVPDYIKGCFVWKKCYGDVNKYTTFEDRIKALTELQQIILNTQNYKIVQGSRSIGYQYEGFVTDCIHQLRNQLNLRAHSVRVSTRRKYAGIVNNVVRFLKLNGLEKLPAGALSESHCTSFFNWLKSDKHLSNASYNAHLILLRSFYTELVKAGKIKNNPFTGFKTMRKNSVASLYFKPDQIEILKHYIALHDRELWQFVQFIYYCFIRPGELRRLKIEDINFDDGRLQIVAGVSKNNKTQYVSIPAQLMETIQQMNLHQYPANFYIFGKGGKPSAHMTGVNNFKNRHRAILKKLKFSLRHKLYSWKHTGAIACAKAGMNLKDLQMQLRHHSLDQVNNYLSDMLVFESHFIKHQYPTL